MVVLGRWEGEGGRKRVGLEEEEEEESDFLMMGEGFIRVLPWCGRCFRGEGVGLLVARWGGWREAGREGGRLLWEGDGDGS